ncbi:MAG: hypothetical protein LBR19_05270 [Bifidobacteriaceae bacterium]|jgi:hypothetical protein|nr:hypothetical protein [Bifidobacteriaceae bacterium]
MKKQSVAGVLAVLLALGLGACSKAASGAGSPSAKETTTAATSSSTEQAGASSVPNPVVQVDSPDAFKDQLGLTLQPDDTATGQSYQIIGGTLAQAEFTQDGAQITARVQKASAFEDISGIYDSYGDPKQVNVGDVDVRIYVVDGQSGYAAWYNEAAGVVGSVAQASGASVESLTDLATFYVNQESKGL